VQRANDRRLEQDSMQLYKRVPLIWGKLLSLFAPQAAHSAHPLLMFGPSFREGSGTMASADSCHLFLVSHPGLPFPAWCQVSPGKIIDFPTHLSNLLFQPLVVLGFAVICQLAQPHSFLLVSCSSIRSFASGFLQTPLHGDALPLPNG